MTRIAIVVTMIVACAAIGCRSDYSSEDLHGLYGGSGYGSGSGSGSADAGVPIDAEEEWIQPTCADDRRTESDDGELDDGHSCDGDATSVICTMVSACPNYCVQCTDSPSVRCYSCP